MLKRGGIYMVGSVSLQNMLTNALHLGAWVFKDRVAQWDNHTAIIPEDLFYKAFNYISPYNLDGTPNEDYAPHLGRRHSTKKKKRDAYEPIYLRLVGSYHEGNWRGATASWTTGMQATPTQSTTWILLTTGSICGRGGVTTLIVSSTKCCLQNSRRPSIVRCGRRC